jgi:hypothetical protein
MKLLGLERRQQREFRAEDIGRSPCFVFRFSFPKQIIGWYGRNKRKSRACVFAGGREDIFFFVGSSVTYQTITPPLRGNLYLQAAK